MPTIAGRHKVKDMNAWLAGHQGSVNLFATAVSRFKTFQDADDPNPVLLAIEGTDMALRGAITNDPMNKPLKDKDTVIESVLLLCQYIDKPH